MFRDESLEKLERKLLTMPSYQCSIFISYQWRQKEIAKALQKTFEAKTDEHGRQKYLVIRDEDFLTNNVYIKNFMKIITHPKLDYVLPIVSASYFESENCMYEVDKILKRYCWDSSLLPYVVTQDTNADAHLYSDPTKYKRHWQQKLLTEVDPKRREILDNIIRNIDRFITVITARMRTPEEKLILNDYQAIFEIVDRNESKKAALLSEGTNPSSFVDTRDDPVSSVSASASDEARASLEQRVTMLISTLSTLGSMNPPPPTAPMVFNTFPANFAVPAFVQPPAPRTQSEERLSTPEFRQAYREGREFALQQHRMLQEAEAEAQAMDAAGQPEPQISEAQQAQAEAVFRQAQQTMASLFQQRQNAFHPFKP